MAAAASDGFGVTQAVFIQCFNEPPVEEARWILDLMSAEGSAVCGLVAHIPVPDGAAAVEDFLDSLRGDDGALPAGLKGGRIAFANQVTEPLFVEGLKALGAAGLSWDFCIRAEDIRNVTQAAKQVPDMPLILDHFGHGGSVDSAYPREEWRAAMAELAATCPNVFVKVGSMFTDGEEAASYFDDAIAMFGYERLLAESNWFVGSSGGSSYHSVYTLLMEACDRAGATDKQKAMVFHENARRAYRLRASGTGTASKAKL
jgi:L-fuconolactonase